MKGRGVRNGVPCMPFRHWNFQKLLRTAMIPRSMPHKLAVPMGKGDDWSALCCWKTNQSQYCPLARSALLHTMVVILKCSGRGVQGWAAHLYSICRAKCGVLHMHACPQISFWMVVNEQDSVFVYWFGFPRVPVLEETQDNLIHSGTTIPLL